MKGVTDVGIEKAVAESICLDDGKQKKILDELEVVSANEDSIDLKTGDRSTYDLIISCAHWPKERKSIVDAIRSHVDGDPAHTETCEEWLQGGTTIILNDRFTAMPSHAVTREDWLKKANYLKDRQYWERLTSVPSHSETSEKWAQRDSDMELINRVTAIPSYRSTDDKWLDHEESIVLSEGKPNAGIRQSDDPAEKLTGQAVHQTHAPVGKESAGNAFADYSYGDISQREAWFPNSRGEKTAHSKMGNGAADGANKRKSENVSKTASRGKDTAQSAHRKGVGRSERDDAAFQTVRTSLPPPHQKAQRRPQLIIGVLAVTAVCLAGFVILLAVMRRAKNEPDTHVISAVMIQPAVDPDTVVQPVSGKVVTGSGEHGAAKPPTQPESDREAKPENRPVEGTVVSASEPAQAPPAEAEEASAESLSSENTASVDSPAVPAPEESGRADDTSVAVDNTDEAEQGASERGQFADAMARLTPSIKSCMVAKRGKLKMKFEVKHYGKVIVTETVDKVFANTTTGYCASSAARSVKLPPSDKESYVFYHTFDL